MSEPDPLTEPEDGANRVEAELPAPNFLSAPPPLPANGIFWGWHDLFLFLFITVLSLGTAMLAAAGMRHLFHLSEARMNIVLVLAQFSAYGVAFTCLKLMFQAEYGEPLLRSLKWLPSAIVAPTLAMMGLGQAFAIAMLGTLMSVPQTENPMTRLMSDRPTSIVIAVLGVTAAPLAEELAFRGLLQPLMISTLGIIPGIAGTSLLFGLMHLEQYGSWYSVVLVALAGAGFGVVRHLTGSTRASAIMHAGYNSLLFVAFFTQKGPPH